ncbi:MAG: peptidoglycan DD-metalloendopeptidase family protein [Alphaproteobacteria bacterium]|nr:peptidoglycan DD-metalloendopeptidase family protein [Alphaproteobacteria bacterium]
MLRPEKYFLFIVALALFFTSNVSAAVVSKQDLEYVQQQVREESSKHKKLQQQADKISREMKQINNLMIKKAKQIQNVEEKTSLMEKEIIKLQKDLKEAEEAFLSEDKKLITNLYALQNLAQKPTEALFVQPLTPVEIVRSAMLLRETVPFLATEAAIIRKELNKINDKKQKIERQIVKISRSKRELENERAKMKDLRAQKSAMMKKISNQTKETQNKIKQLADQAKDIKELLEKLEKERKARATLEAERREKARREREELEAYRKERDYSSSKDDLIKSQPEFIKETGKAFAKAKGKLSKPAMGGIVIAYGQETSKGVTSKGISIKTRSQAQVVSPYDGSVIFAGPFRGYGKLIIIEHGEGYMSLLAGMNEIECEVGQMLLAGEPVGQMPDDNNSNLYMELRKDNKPIDPEAWIAK